MVTKLPVSHSRCSIKKLLLKIPEYSQENTCVRVFFNKAADRNTSFEKICERLFLRWIMYAWYINEMMQGVKKCQLLPRWRKRRRQNMENISWNKPTSL